jgi:hypothetical protein
MYANKSLKNILEVHTDVLTNTSPEKNKNDLLKRQLMETKIIPYVSGGTNNKKGGSMNSGLPSSSTSNIWQFLAKNEKGSTFELPLANFSDDDSSVGGKSSISLNKKYITLN